MQFISYTPRDEYDILIALSISTPRISLSVHGGNRVGDPKAGGFDTTIHNKHASEYLRSLTRV